MLEKKRWLVILGALFLKMGADWNLIETFMSQAVAMKYPETLTPLEAYSEIIGFWENVCCSLNN